MREKSERKGYEPFTLLMSLESQGYVLVQSGIICTPILSVMDQVVQDYKAKSDREQNNIWNFWVTLFGKSCNFFTIDKIWYTSKNDYCHRFLTL